MCIFNQEVDSICVSNCAVPIHLGELGLESHGKVMEKSLNFVTWNVSEHNSLKIQGNPDGKHDKTHPESSYLHVSGATSSTAGAPELQRHRHQCSG